MVEVTCKRSGLVFEAKSRRFKIHPEIAEYSEYLDEEYRSLAFRIIQKGKKEGWSTIEKFKEEIESNWRKYNDPNNIKGLYACHYIAQIVDSDPKYRFKREFLKPIGELTKKKNRLKYQGYDLSLLADGIYEVSRVFIGKFNYPRVFTGELGYFRIYWQIEDGDRKEITLDETRKIFPIEGDDRFTYLRSCKALDIPVYDRCFELNGNIYFIDGTAQAVLDENDFEPDNPNYSGDSARLETIWFYRDATKREKAIIIGDNTPPFFYVNSFFLICSGK